MSQQTNLWRSLVAPRSGLIVAALAVGTGGLSSNGYLVSRGDTGYPLLPSVRIDTGRAQRSNVQAASNLAAIRSALGISANDLGRMLGVSRQRIYDWLRGELPNQDRITLINEIVASLSSNRGRLQGFASKLGSRVLPSGYSVVSGIAGGIAPGVVIEELVSQLDNENSARDRLNESLRSRVRRNRGRSDIDSIG